MAQTDDMPKTFHGWDVEHDADAGTVRMRHPSKADPKNGKALYVDVTGKNASPDVLLAAAKLAALEEEVRIAPPDDAEAWTARRDAQARFVNLGKALRPILSGHNDFSSSLERLTQLGWVPGEAAPGVPEGVATYERLSAAKAKR